MNAVWYRRTVTITEAWAGQSVHLHFGAVDYEPTVWVNGTEVYRHRGGFTSFTCHLEGVAAPGETAVIVVRARDLQNEAKPSGKQSMRYENFGCCYTRTTGIWQTVWLEPVPSVSMKRPRITPHVITSRTRPSLRITCAPGSATFDSSTIPSRPGPGCSVGSRFLERIRRNQMESRLRRGRSGAAGIVGLRGTTPITRRVLRTSGGPVPGDLE